MTKSLAAAAGVFVLLFVPLGAATPGSVSGKVATPGPGSAAGVVISLEAPGLKVTPPKAPVEVDQRNLHFVPHVVAIVKGATVKWLNDDTVEHNVFSPQGGYDLGTWGPGESRTHTFTKPGVYAQLCRLHTEMEGWVVVLDTPYFAVTGDSGAFDIKGVPPGRYTLKTWSGTLKASTRPITVEGGKPTTVRLTLER
jgi:plastocyanin